MVASIKKHILCENQEFLYTLWHLLWPKTAKWFTNPTLMTYTYPLECQGNHLYLIWKWKGLIKVAWNSFYNTSKNLFRILKNDVRNQKVRKGGCTPTPHKSLSYQCYFSFSIHKVNVLRSNDKIIIKVRIWTRMHMNYLFQRFVALKYPWKRIIQLFFFNLKCPNAT